MTDKKITDDQLLQEIQEGKTEKKIAHDNGYGYPSAALNDRIHELGYTSNQKITLKSNCAGQFYLGSEPMEQAAEQAGIDLQEADKVFFQVDEVVNGRICLEMTTDSFRKVQDD
jgi:hypothetical protein